MMKKKFFNFFFKEVIEEGNHNQSSRSLYIPGGGQFYITVVCSYTYYMVGSPLNAFPEVENAEPGGSDGENWPNAASLCTEMLSSIGFLIWLIPSVQSVRDSTPGRKYALATQKQSYFMNHVKAGTIMGTILYYLLVIFAFKLGVFSMKTLPKAVFDLHFSHHQLTTQLQ